MQVNIFFSAHGVPKSYVEEAGDPYKEEMEECVALIMNELQRRGNTNPHVLAYQSRVGPVEWLKPYTDVTIRWVGLLAYISQCKIVSASMMVCTGIHVACMHMQFMCGMWRVSLPWPWACVVDALSKTVHDCTAEMAVWGAASFLCVHTQ